MCGSLSELYNGGARLGVLGYGGAVGGGGGLRGWRSGGGLAVGLGVRESVEWNFVCAAAETNRAVLQIRSSEAIGVGKFRFVTVARRSALRLLGCAPVQRRPAAARLDGAGYCAVARAHVRVRVRARALLSAFGWGKLFWSFFSVRLSCCTICDYAVVGCRRRRARRWLFIAQLQSRRLALLDWPATADVAILYYAVRVQQPEQQQQ